MSEIVLKEESYKIMGLVFEVYNKLGPFGYQERQYHKAREVKFRNNDIKFESQKEIELPYEGDKIRKFYLDFVIGEHKNKILLEIKKSQYIILDDIRQTKRYLEATGIRLRIIVNFGKRKKIQYKRILNSRVIRD